MNKGLYDEFDWSEGHKTIASFHIAKITKTNRCCMEGVRIRHIVEWDGISVYRVSMQQCLYHCTI